MQNAMHAPGFRRWRFHPGCAVAKVITTRSIEPLSELASQEPH
jgi:hypothetical protein